MRSPQDRELAEKAGHDPEAFGALYDRYFEGIYRLVYGRVRNQALAQDLTARVFFRALKLIKGHRHVGTKFSSWLGTLALMTLARSGYIMSQPRQGPAADNGLQSAGRPAPLRPTRPTLSTAVALPQPPVDDGPGIVYALGRSR
ncbi:MAG TPA: sigma factor [Candidatus Acidoferrum sp.]|nr:sigma factor [Candidatus Acidoferrum sp.]